MSIPPTLQELALQHPIISNGLQLHLAGGASLTSTLIAIIEALAEANTNQQMQLMQVLQERRSTFFLPSADTSN